MEINSDYASVRPDAAAPAADAAVKSDARPARLAEGDVVKGEVVDLKADAVTVKTASGETVTAKLSAPIDAKIGQTQTFTVRLNEKGELVFDMRAVSKAAMHKDAIADALSSFGLKAGPENMKLAALLLENQMPLTKDALQKLSRALKLLGGEDAPQNVEKAMFLLKNQMPVTPKTAATLNALAEGQLKLGAELAHLVKALDAMPPSELKNQLIQTLIGGESAIGDDAVIKNTVEQLKAGLAEGIKQMPQAPANAEAAALSAQIERAFQKPLSPDGFVELGKRLLAEFPAQKEQILALVAEKTAVAKTIAENAAELAAKITQMARDETLTKEGLASLLQEVSAKGGQPPKQLPEPDTQLVKFLIERVFSGKDGEAAQKLLQLFPEAAKETPAASKENLLKALSLKLSETDPKMLDDLLNRLKGNIEADKALLSEARAPEAAKIMEHLSKAGDNLEFVAQARQNLFAHIPLVIAGQETNAELYVFQDKRKKKKLGEKISALIALDTLSMGRFEVYVQKNDKSVTCAFRLQDEAVEKLVRANIPKLETLLAQARYRLDGFTTQQLAEAFTLLHDEPDAESLEHALGRITFDMRT